ncbi:MAG: hypothetical protein N3I35_09330 [Clostridia bacterium]|nr:hypothetical protein [Clostridia bacterium]
MSFNSFLCFSHHGDGDVIVAAGNKQRNEVVDMDRELYADLGFAVIWCIKYIFIPFGVAVSSRYIAEKLLRPQSERQRKKRSVKNRFNK